MTRRNLNLPISSAHGLTVEQMADFLHWVERHPFKEELTLQQTRWLVAECFDNCFDVPTPDAPSCARSTFETWLDVANVPTAGQEA